MTGERRRTLLFRRLDDSDKTPCREVRTKSTRARKLRFTGISITRASTSVSMLSNKSREIRIFEGFVRCEP
ncbi:hypothetical protein QN277_017267 [Acacia crassicarpa]|uniref:Uncharacterized protein n=1 Tax=Acacia crassicarpa TaxID=499986 RepID=A0AAE1MRM6_9FABA|nr:hypothetical protein QN277_017267 [Acacia crassicarpa]